MTDEVSLKGLVPAKLVMVHVMRNWLISHGICAGVELDHDAPLYARYGSIGFENTCGIDIPPVATMLIFYGIEFDVPSCIIGHRNGGGWFEYESISANRLIHQGHVCQANLVTNTNCAC